jgi:hypothetical protein
LPVAITSCSLLEAAQSRDTPKSRQLALACAPYVQARKRLAGQRPPRPLRTH